MEWMMRQNLSHQWEHRRNDDKTKQNYAQWEGDGGVYKIWLEDTQSLEEKLKVIKENQLAGVAEWSLGMEGSGVWDLILQYVN